MPTNGPSSPDLQPIEEIDQIIHSPTRLKILAYLSVVESADFTYLMNQTGLTRGNLSVNLRKLEEAGYVSIQKEFVDRTPRTMRTTLLGTPVIIRATASAYSWDWGDGVQSVTTKPGAAYPNQTVAHTYLYREGPVTIRLTTSWRGSYSTDGGATWRSAPGTGHTTSTPVTVTVYDPHGHRVDCDLEGTCVSGADGPSEEA